MSALTSVELPKEVIAFWRKTLGANHGQFGIDWLRRNHSHAKGETDLQMIRNAARWEGYMQALDDIEDRLTAIPAPEQTLEEEPLERPDLR